MKKMCVILFLGVIILVGFVSADCVWNDCTDKNIVLCLDKSTNAHGAKPNILGSCPAGYPQKFCCDSVGSELTIYLSDTHASKTTNLEYSIPILLPGCSLSCEIGEDPVLYLSKIKDAHLSSVKTDLDGDNYLVEICCGVGDIPCVTNCVGKECGNDGCDDVCGTCEDDETCTDGICTEEINYDTSCSDYSVDDCGSDPNVGFEIYFGAWIIYGTSGECSRIEFGVGCIWDILEAKCLQATDWEYDNPEDGLCDESFGPCTYSENIDGDCSLEGVELFTIIRELESGTAADGCSGSSQTLPCGAEGEEGVNLPFFGFYNFMITLVLILFIYGFLILRRKEW